MPSPANAFLYSIAAPWRSPVSAARLRRARTGCQYGSWYELSVSQPFAGQGRPPGPAPRAGLTALVGSRRFAAMARKTPGKSGDSRAQATIGIDLDCLPTLLGFNIRRAQIALWRDFNRNVAEGDVRPGVFSALLLAHANPGIAQVEIGNQLGIDKASVVTLIDRMEDAGWVVRKRSSDDRRRQGIFLTPAGSKTCRALRREMIDE